jgi:hypothetical protein
MKKKNGLLQTFFYDFFENSSDELGTANTLLNEIFILSQQMNPYM